MKNAWFILPALICAIYLGVIAGLSTQVDAGGEQSRLAEKVSEVGCKELSWWEKRKLSNKLLDAAKHPGSANEIPGLVLLGADVDSTSTWGNTALMLAAARGNTESVKALIDEGADVNYAHQCDSTTALMLAATKGNADSVKILISAGADVNCRQTKYGPQYWRTALIMAVEGGHIECVEAILQAPDVDVFAENINDITALDIAKKKSNQKIIQCLQEYITQLSQREKQHKH